MPDETTTKPLPPPATQPPAAPADAPEGETPVTADEAVELSPTEQRLESVRGKLEKRHEELVGKNREASDKMATLDLEIGALEAQLPSIRAAVMAAHADLHQAQGAHAAIGGLIGRLRAPGETNPVQRLEQLIEENHALARGLAVTLVGEDDADALLKNPMIDEGTARGLVFEIKTTLRPAISDKADALRALIGKVRTGDQQYINAEIHLRNAEVDLAQAEARRDDLLRQIQHSLATIQALQENIKSTDAVAGKLEEEQAALRTGNVQINDKAVQGAMGQERLTHELLGRKRLERDATEIVLREFMTSEERVTRLLAALDGMLDTYTTATERLAQVPTLVDKMGGLEDEFSRKWMGASRDIQPALVSAGNGVNDAIMGIMGYGVATRDGVIEELRTQAARLGELLGRFDDATAAADAPAADPKDLPWQAYEQLIAASEDLQRFLKQDWERLRGGSVDKIEALCDGLRQRLDRALRPLAIVRKASDEIAALPAGLPAATPPAPAPAAAPAAAPAMPAQAATPPPAPVATPPPAAATAPAAAPLVAAPAPAAPPAATQAPAPRTTPPGPPPPDGGETIPPPDEPPDDRPDEPDQPPE